MKKPALIFFGRPKFRQSLYDYQPALFGPLKFFIFQNPFSCARYFKRINERYSVSLNVTNGIAIAMHFLSARENSIEKKIECFG